MIITLAFLALTYQLRQKRFSCVLRPHCGQWSQRVTRKISFDGSNF